MSSVVAPKRIAVTTEFSETSTAAFPMAALLARAFSAELYLIHAARKDPGMGMPWKDLLSYSVPAGFLDKVRDKLGELAHGHGAFDGLRVIPVLLRGSPPAAIKKFVAENRIDLLVMSAHGHTGFQKMILGSVTEKTLRSAPCSVLVVRRSDVGVAPERLRPARILVCCDFSPHSREGIAVARRWGQAFSAKVRVVTVVPDRLLIYHYSSGPEKFREFVEEIERDAKLQLSRIVRGSAGDDEVTTVIRHGQVVQEILTEIESYQPDLVIIGTLGMTADEQFQLGRVAEKTIRKARCAVLAVRPQGRALTP